MQYCGNNCKVSDVIIAVHYFQYCPTLVTGLITLSHVTCELKYIAMFRQYGLAGGL